MVRRVIAYKNHFIDFYNKQDFKVQVKIEYVLDLVRFEKRVPKKYFKFLIGSDGIYEVIVITTYKSIRILCFFDEGDIIVLTNCFIKKSQKTPRQEIKLAERLKMEYLNEKGRME